jgi:hypothetical protein
MRSELQVAQFADMLMALRCEECWPSPKGAPTGLGGLAGHPWRAEMVAGDRRRPGVTKLWLTTG